MKISFCHILFFALIISQAISSIQSEILNNVSHVLDGISDQKTGPSTHAADSNNSNNSNNNNPPSTPSPSPSSSPATPSPALPPPSPSTSAAPPVSSNKPEPPPVVSTTPSPADKPATVPTTPQKPLEHNSEKNTTPPATNNNPSTPDTTTSPNNKPTTPNNENTNTQNAPTPTTTSSASSSSSSSGNSKVKGNKGSPTSDDATVSTETNVPSFTNDINRAVAAPNNTNSSGNKTSVIVGAVVGSIFGVALIGGALTWINRHGGCAKRSNKRSAEFDDYGLADTDFPHTYQQQPQMRSPGIQAMNLAGSGAGATVAAAATVGGGASPTIPRLNDQGTFYGNTTVEDPYNNNQMQPMTGYHQDVGNGASPALAAADYNANQMPVDYTQQQQQAYYYQQQPQDGGMGMAGGNTGYYSEQPGYYYDPNHHPANVAYDMPAQYNQHGYADQTTYTAAAPNGDHYYKPDQVDINHQRRM